MKINDDSTLHESIYDNSNKDHMIFKSYNSLKMIELHIDQMK